MLKRGMRRADNWDDLGGDATIFVDSRCCVVPGVEKSEPPRQVWMIIVNGLTLDDLREEALPNFRHLLERGAVAGMNLKTGKREWDPHIYATLGAETRIAAPTDATFYHPGEEMGEGLAGEQFLLRTGFKPSEKAVVYPAVYRYIRENESGNYRMSPGALGEALRRAGRKTAVLGNWTKGTWRFAGRPFCPWMPGGSPPWGASGGRRCSRIAGALSG